MPASTSRTFSLGNFSNSPENRNSVHTGIVSVPATFSAASARKAGLVTSVPPVHSRLGLGLTKLPMWMPTGTSASCATAQKRSSSGWGSKSPLGIREMTTPRWPLSTAQVSSASASSTPVVGITAWGMTRPAVCLPKSRTHSLYVRTQNFCSSGSSP